MKTTATAFAAAAAATVLLLAGCATPSGADETVTIPPEAVPTSPVPTTASATPADDAAPSCETLIPPQTVTDFQNVGWTYQQEPFMVAATEIPGGLTCKWGDYSGSAEGVQIFGWAPIDAAASTRAQDELLANGWRRIDTDEGVYITERLDTAFATGAEGYGLTYQFGDGWVIFADTKQSLLLVERPDA